MGEMKSCRQRAYQSSAWLVHAKGLLKAGACPNTRWQQGYATLQPAGWFLQPQDPTSSAVMQGLLGLRGLRQLPRRGGGCMNTCLNLMGWGISEPIPTWLKRRLFGGYFLCPLTEFLHPAPWEPLFSCCMETTPGCRVVSVATGGFRALRTGVQIPILALPHLVTWNNSV